ncbi:hypothetical protein CDAR_366401 [Caerostris darwini]|uniref:Uncharacterized protein n=1 Tax=Caerostris darwini TaxID=1538125 RepID=A0AAV4Q3P2_9ARAC|nr:hypothetical protein CDAR_366401 [Caerostris darwini]
MFAKVLVFCAALVAVQASGIGYGASILSAAPLGIGKGLVSVPTVSTVSSQKSVINHVAPAARVTLAGNRLIGGYGIAGNGLIGNGLIGGHGIGSNGVIAGNGILSNGIVGGYGIGPIGTGLLGAPVGLGHGTRAVSTQKSVINHVAPAARVAVAAAPIALANNGIIGNGLIGGHGIASNGVIAGNGILSNGIVGGYGIGPIGTGLLGAPVGLGLGHGVVASQKSVIAHVAPAARVAVTAAPIALASNGILANGVGGYGVANGLIGGHGIAGNGILVNGGYGGHGIAGNGILVNGGYGGHGIAGNGILVNGGYGGHGIAGNGILVNGGYGGHGIGLGKAIL